MTKPICTKCTPASLPGLLKRLEGPDSNGWKIRAARSYSLSWTSCDFLNFNFETKHAKTDKGKPVYMSAEHSNDEFVRLVLMTRGKD